MSTHRSLSRSHRAGFALIEALIALLLIAVGLVAVSKLQTFSLFGSGDARMRTEAANIAQQQLEELRNVLKRGDMTVLDAIKADEPVSKLGASTNFEVYRNITQPAGGPPDQRLVQITVKWNNAQGAPQRLDLNTVLAWDDPSMQAVLANNPGGGQLSNLIAPTGEAQRGGPGEKVPDKLDPTQVNHDGTKIYSDGITTWLADAQGNIILKLPPKDNAPQSFTTITGRVYFDPSSQPNALPDSGNVLVRLSSEGECIYKNAPADLKTAPQNFKYFIYTCYVGPGWYGNVGVTIVATKGNAGNANICVGDAAFNGGLSNGTQTSAHPSPTSVRTYRGFRTSGGASGYESTGVAGGGKYGQSYEPNGDPTNGPSDGCRRPSAPTAETCGDPANATDYLNQDFLITDLGGGKSCKTQMTGSLFARNAGQYLCISPDRYSSDPDKCPTAWPLEKVSTGGSVNYTLTVIPSGTGAGNVTSSVGGVACGGNCSALIASGTSVVLTAEELSGSTFAGWTGCPSGNAPPIASTPPTPATCTLSMTDNLTVGAIFNSGNISTSYALSVNKEGTGTVSSSPSGISCGTLCSTNFSSGTVVSLTATPGSGQEFLGWSGACNGMTACNVTMSQARSVGAKFSATVQTCATIRAGTMIDKEGSVSSTPGAPAAICNSKTGNNEKGFECKFTAVPGAQFVLRNIRTSNPPSNQDYDVPMTITADCTDDRTVEFKKK